MLANCGMKFFKRMVLGLLIGSTAVVALALLFGLQGQALVAPTADLVVRDIQQAKDFLRRNDPRLGGVAPSREVFIHQDELNLLLGQVAQRYGGGAAAVQLKPGSAALQASIKLASLASHSFWINIDSRLRETAALPEFDRLRVGHLPLPAWAANWLLHRLLTKAQTQGQLATDLIAQVEQVRFGTQQLNLAYQWRPDSLQRVLANLWPTTEQQRVSSYDRRLATLAQAYPPGSAVSLAVLLPPMFELARQRSALPGSDAVAENRAAILTLALHASGQSWGLLMPTARAWPRATPLQVTLAGRDDFPQHFLISAALAIEGGGALADVIGVYKEVADSRGGSGFSFNDIAADRAGTRFGIRAGQAPRLLQAALLADLTEAAFMPDVADLPEFLTERDFVVRYGGIGAPAYRLMMADIEARLDATALLR
jgi:hypothetical protein